MMSLLKNVGKGLLYILVTPLFLLVLFLTAIFGLFLIIFMFFKSIILFFTGRSLDDELPEDRMAREIKEGKNRGTTTTPVVEPTPQPAKEQTIEEAVFGSSPEQPQKSTFETIESDEPIVDEPPVEEPEPQPEEDDFPTIETESEPVLPPKKEEPIKKYTPHSNQSIFLNSDEDEEEEDSGVTISYGDDDE